MMKVIFKLMLIFSLVSCLEEIKNSDSTTPVTIPGQDINLGENHKAVQSILLSSCNECHSDWANDFSKIIGENGNGAVCDGCDSVRVVPGDPENSSLYLSLLGAVPGTQITRMPKSSSLSASDTQVVYDWIISLGASNDSTEVRMVEESYATENFVIVTQEFDRFKSVIHNKCIWCHRPGGSYKGIDDYESLDTPEQWVSSGFINPGSASQSKIVMAMTQNGLAQMPPNNLPEVSAADMAKVNTWINSLPANGGGSTGGGAAALRFTQARSVLQNKCIGCHSVNNTQGGFRADYTTEQDFINNNAIVKNQANSSRLFIDIDGSLVPGGEDDMPRGNNNSIQLEEVIILRNWINQIP